MKSFPYKSPIKKYTDSSVNIFTCGGNEWKFNSNITDGIWETGQPDTELVKLYNEGWLDDVNIALELGCCTGDTSIYLSDKNINIIGLDINQDAIDIANNKVNNNNARFICSNIFDLPKPDFDIDFIYDNTIYQNCIKYKESEVYLNTIKRLTNKGTLFFGNWMSLKQKYSEFSEYNLPLVEKNKIINDFSKFFEIIFIREGIYDFTNKFKFYSHEKPGIDSWAILMKRI